MCTHSIYILWAFTQCRFILDGVEYFASQCSHWSGTLTPECFVTWCLIRDRCELNPLEHLWHLCSTVWPSICFRRDSLFFSIFSHTTHLTSMPQCFSWYWARLRLVKDLLHFEQAYPPLSFTSCLVVSAFPFQFWRKYTQWRVMRYKGWYGEWNGVLHWTKIRQIGCVMISNITFNYILDTKFLVYNATKSNKVKVIHR